MPSIRVIFKESKDKVAVRWTEHQEHAATHRALKAWNRDIVSFSAWTDCTA